MSLLSARAQLAALREVTLLLSRHRRLTWEMTKRDFTDRYTRQFFGILWAIGHPLVLMGIYVFIFGFVFKVEVGGNPECPLNYTIYLLSGLIPWMAVQEAMAKGTSAITSNANLVKQVFPVEVLPVKIALAASISQLIYTAILIVYTLARYGFLHWTVCLTPILLILQFVGSVGLCYILSSLAVHFRDMKDFVQVFCVAGMYVLPVCYLPQWVPSAFQPLLAFNPFSHMAWCWQDCLYFGRFEHPVAWIVFPLGSLAMCCIGYRLFRKLKVCFGSLL